MKFNCTSSEANPAVSSYVLLDGHNQGDFDENGTWIRKISEEGSRTYHCQAIHILQDKTSEDNITLTVHSKFVHVCVVLILKPGVQTMLIEFFLMKSLRYHYLEDILVITVLKQKSLITLLIVQSCHLSLVIIVWK